MNQHPDRANQSDEKNKGSLFLLFRFWLEVYLQTETTFMVVIFFSIEGVLSMKGKRIVVGITGGIAAFKSASLVSQLAQRGADVRVIMTQSATQFITPLTFQTLSRNEVAVDLFEEKNPQVVSHIDLSDHADLFVIAPATANIIGKIAHGLGDDMLTTTLLATEAPVCFAPAMNVHMYQNPIVQQNFQRLQSFGYYFIEPGEGQLACGYVGKGRMAEPEEILQWIDNFFKTRQCLTGKRLLVTAGPTVEPIDPVRYISNYSSGKMGYAIAEAAEKAGAEVTLVSGPVALSPPARVKCIQVKSAFEMRDVVMDHLDAMDIIIKAAAVADYRPRKKFEQKMKKKRDSLTIELEKNPDIAVEIGKRKRSDQFFVGFAAETENLEQYAREKLDRKGMDLIIANQVSLPGIGFNSDQNQVVVYDAEGEVLHLPKMKKEEVASRLISLIGERVNDS